MKLGLDGKNALITGGSRGLGLAVALELSKQGANVAIISRNANDLKKNINMFDNPDRHYYIETDLMQENSADLIHEKISHDFGKIDILIHNIGGTFGIRDPLAPIEDYLKVWRLNFGIACELNRCFIPDMVKEHWGRVIFISSSSAVNLDGSLPYGVAKAAVNAYVKGLGRKYASDGIVVSGIMPGPFVSGDGHWDHIRENDPKKYNNLIENHVALRRLGTAEEIAHSVVFLASEKAPLFIGSVLSTDGGYY
ncbi:MAG TPA: SDR family oxidoreductase [Clostridia bacterium]